MMLDEALHAFIVESRELLDRMEEALLCIEQQPDDAETINAIFRAAHTIKGSSGIFGLDDIVAFTHVAESVLDEVRAGRIRFDHELASVMLASGDHIRRLVERAAAGEHSDATTQAQGQQLLDKLSRWLAPAATRPGPPAAPGAAPASVGVPAAALASAPAGTGPNHWHLALRFGPETLRDGFDPLSFLRYLTRLGQVHQVVVDRAAVPPLSALEPDHCHLAMDVALSADTDAATLASVFEFVQEDSDIRILPPGSPAQAYADLARDAQGQPDPAREQALRQCGSWPVAELACASAADAQPATTVSAASAALGETRPQIPVDSPSPATAAGAGETEPAMSANAAPVAGTRGAEVQMLRVEAAKLDRLINLVGELLIAGAGAALVARQKRDKAMIQASSAVSQLMEEVRDTALSLRMVQIGATFNRFQRMVRDISQELGKDIVLRISGADTELDKTVVERLADPLTHLVRNAMDHGIESAAQRLAAGKPAQGAVHLHAYHEAGQVVVEVGDDGRGLSRQRIFEVAVQRGVVAADAQLSDQEVYQLIFQPGFSTAEQVSNLSGRGVGMDVVARSIHALRGSIDIDTQPGQGTTVRLRLPLTLAIIDGFLLGVGAAHYVVPLNAVVECIELTESLAADRDWMDLRGEVLPVIRLRELYEIEGSPGRRQNVVVLRQGEQRFGLVVDQLLGELQTVIRPLGKVFERLQGVSGFTILGNGSVALLLEVAGLLKQAGPGGDVPSAASPRPVRPIGASA